MTLLKEVKVFRSVDAIGRDSINSIADDAFFTYEWFKTLETQKTFGISPIYLVVYDNGNLVGVAPCFIDLLDQYFHYAPQVRYILPALKKMLIIGRRLGFCQEHVLLCYSPFSYRSKVLIRKNSEKNHILSLLAEKIDVVCRQERFLFSSFLFVSEFDKLLMDNLQNFSYLKCPGITTFYFDVQFSSFEDYLKSFTCKERKNLRREIRKCSESGVTIEETEFRDLSTSALSALSSNLTLKYNKNANISYSSFFSKLSEHTKDKTKVFIAKKNDAIVGFSLNLRQGEIMENCFAGFKYDVLTNTDFTYFNVCYYAPIRWAIEEGLKRIY